MQPSAPPSQEFLLNALCTRCGFDLRANNISGPCPKCGLELPYATFVSGLADANQIWLDRIYMGITGILIAKCMVILQCAGQLLVFASASNYWGSRLWTRLYEMHVGIELFSAIFLLAAREFRDEKEPWSSPRKLLIWLGGARVIIHLTRPFFYYVERGSTPTLAMLFRNFMTVLETGAAVVLFLYILRIGQRTGDPFLKRHLPVLLSLTVISYGLSILLSARSSPISQANVFDLALTVQLAVSVYAVYVLLHMRRSIGSVIQEAHH